MSRTALDHYFVRDYLSRLDAALRHLPAPQARELRAQITTHLEDALPPDADNIQITEALRQLGDPADLAAEARAALGPTVGQAFGAAARRRWAAVVGARKRTKIIAVLTVLLLAGGAIYADVLASAAAVYESAPLIEFAGESGWWYPQDYNREVDTSADGAQQTTVPVRSGQRQGFAIGVENPSNFAQTIIGPVLGLNAPYDSPNGGFGPVQIDVSVPDSEIANGGFIRNIAFTSVPAVIPPHQYRELRITWISGICLTAGGASIIDSLYLRVRVGPVTRTDVIPLQQGWALAGPSHPQPTESITTCG
jgi:hypothetical protein